MVSFVVTSKICNFCITLHPKKERKTDRKKKRFPCCRCLTHGDISSFSLSDLCIKNTSQSHFKWEAVKKERERDRERRGCRMTKLLFTLAVLLHLCSSVQSNIHLKEEIITGLDTLRELQENHTLNFTSVSIIHWNNYTLCHLTLAAYYGFTAMCMMTDTSLLMTFNILIWYFKFLVFSMWIPYIFCPNSSTEYTYLSQVCLTMQ